jgi:hypothetical protein
MGLATHTGRPWSSSLSEVSSGSPPPISMERPLPRILRERARVQLLCAAGPPQRRPTRRGRQRGRVNAQSEAVRQARQMVEHPHDVGHLEAALVVEPDLAQRGPVVGADRVRVGAQLLRDRAQRAGAG